MILWIYGEETNTHFQMEWILFSYTTVNTGWVFNWEKILTFNIY
jgi:hypothetical protein